MESKIISNNLLLQTTDLEEFNKSSTIFGKKPYGFVTVGNLNTPVLDLSSKTLAITVDNGTFLQQKGKLHLRNEVSMGDLNKVIKDYE